MKLPSNRLLLLALGALLLPASGKTAVSPDPFAVVPVSDSTYSQLAQLERAGLLPQGDASGPLTRFEVANRIWKAEKKYDEIVVAQADDIPPPPAEGPDTSVAPSAAPAAATAPAPAAAPASPAPAPVAAVQTTPTLSPAEEAAELAKADQNLHSLSEAYQYELKRIQDKVKAVQDHAAAVDDAQFNLLKKLKGITEYPNVAIHGLGRVFAFSQQYFGLYSPLTFANPTTRATYGYLDLMPEGVVAKQVSWNSVLRFGTSLNPDTSADYLFFRRISLNVKAPWFTATLGDFDESYTPLTLWNRDSLDLRFMPEMMARQDQTAKYESFFDNEPNWPFRGLRLNTDIAWPDSSPIDRFKLSAFGNMIANGFNADTKSFGFYGPTNFTGWIFGGNSELKLQKLYLGGMSLQLGVGGDLVILDEPLGTNTPGAPHDPTDPTTWAHQYVVSSWKPDLKIGFGGDAYLGGDMDMSFASYQDDKMNANSVISDYAFLGGPYLQLGDSRISFNFLNVGPNYYSPLAQIRQDNPDVTQSPESNSLFSPELYQSPLRSQYFLTDVPRPSGVFGFYDRTQDNTFPYGLATPNREGIGLELDVKALKKQALKIKGSAYLVQEIGGNIVANSSQTGYTTVDAPSAGVTLIRNFTYVNFGPSLNLGPLMDWDRDLEIGANARFEQTSSSLGTLTSTWILGGIRVGVTPGWDLSGAFSTRNVSGVEMGYLGTLWARYSYIFDNSDVGQYGVVNVNGNIQTLRLSSVFKVNRNSNFYLDYDVTQGNLYPTGLIPGTLNNQYMELTYEIQF